MASALGSRPGGEGKWPSAKGKGGEAYNVMPPKRKPFHENFEPTTTTTDRPRRAEETHCSSQQAGKAETDGGGDTRVLATQAGGRGRFSLVA